MENEMKKSVVILVVLCFVESQAYAVTGDSTTWEGFYEATVLPTADTSYKSTAWGTAGVGAPVGGIFTEGSISYLKMTEDAGGTTVEGYARDPSDVDATFDASYAVRMRANTMNTWVSGAFDFANPIHGDLGMSFIGDEHPRYLGTAGDGGHNFKVFVGAGGANGSIVIPESTVGDFSDWHTYRITVHHDTPTNFFPKVNLYLDNNPTPAATKAWAFHGPGGTFGAVTVNTNDPYEEDTDIDWIRWTTTGEFAPLPKPCDFTTDGLCGLADINDMFAQGDLTGAGVAVSSGNQFDLDTDNDIDGDDITEWLSLTGTANGFSSPMLRGDTDNVGASSPTSRTVDITDFQNFLGGFTGAGSTWEVGNFNGDDVVDITDFSNHFLPNFSATGGGTYGAGQSIPEPSAVLLLGLGGVLLTYACFQKRGNKRSL